MSCFTFDCGLNFVVWGLLVWFAFAFALSICLGFVVALFCFVVALVVV